MNEDSSDSDWCPKPKRKVRDVLMEEATEVLSKLVRALCTFGAAIVHV